jgi:hypothetical protein
LALEADEGYLVCPENVKGFREPWANAIALGLEAVRRPGRPDLEGLKALATARGKEEEKILKKP